MNPLDTIKILKSSITPTSFVLQLAPILQNEASKEKKLFQIFLMVLRVYFATFQYVGIDIHISVSRLILIATGFSMLPAKGHYFDMLVIHRHLVWLRKVSPLSLFKMFRHL